LANYKERLANLSGVVPENGLGTGAPGGRFLFIEHVAARQGAWLRFIQGGLKPIWCQMGDGCHPDRETWLASEARVR
jgi:hypothetical protein